MNYSIFINPKSQQSSASQQAFDFMQTLKTGEFNHINLFFYSYAVECAFFNDSPWKTVKQKNISLIACSTIAENFIKQKLMAHDNFTIAGLGQWMESTINADKRVEFI